MKLKNVFVPFVLSLLVILPGSVHVLGRSDTGESPGRRAFDRMKTLVGKWQATTKQGKKAFLDFDLVSNGSVLMERFIDEGSEKYTNMVTMYHMDRNRLMLTHYCGHDNQPRMRAETISPDLSTIIFDFFDGTNMKSPNDQHMHSAAYEFNDTNHITTTWRLYRDGKEIFIEALDFKRTE